jgi:hypothetical protein
MVWSRTKGRDYLLRSAYDKSGRRRQISLGPRSAETERMKAEFERARAEAEASVATLEPVLARQAAVNRALGLGRVPRLGARILRALDAAGVLGAGIRVVGTHALYAYEASAGVHFEPGLTTTEDVDLLLDARRALAFVASDGVEASSLMEILRKVDRSFERRPERYRAANREGYLVDLIAPLRDPPWHSLPDNASRAKADLSAVEIEGLAWLENAPPFEAVAIDERGEPLRIVASDPRAFAAHKLWLSERLDRQPLHRSRDHAQALAVGTLVATHLPHLPFAQDELRMLPLAVFHRAQPLFRTRE